MARSTTPDVERIGATVRRIREQQGLRVRELAEKAGLTRWTITNIEAGHVRAHGSSLGRIARALGVDLSEITG